MPARATPSPPGAPLALVPPEHWQASYVDSILNDLGFGGGAAGGAAAAARASAAWRADRSYYVPDLTQWQ